MNEFVLELKRNTNSDTNHLVLNNLGVIINAVEF